MFKTPPIFCDDPVYKCLKNIISIRLNLFTQLLQSICVELFN